MQRAIAHGLVMVVLTIVLSPAPARAACTATPGSFATAAYAFPSTIMVPRDLPNGTQVAPLTRGNPSTVTITCSGDPYGLVNSVGATPAVGQTRMPIGTTGLSWEWSFRGRNIFEASYGTSSLSGSHSSTAGTGQRLVLVKTGPVAAGTVIPAGELGRRRYGLLDIWAVRLSSAITVVTPSCTTSDVTVPMGSHRSSELSGVGSSGASVSFSISLACSTGLSRIRYRVDPLTTVINDAQSVVALDAGSTASGVGLQLLNGSGSGPHPLSVSQLFTGAVGAGAHEIPLRARYYQTAGQVVGGTANTALTFTLTYE
ncbi:type 1 fimbrial protein [Lysobacter sp. S4-A87]|uniref:fimbrial protein n=1 Tax=Lysobacter sp. S4-A87 TaxID=2925843 RepID=UPI001F53BF7F|nr:fimbrial protein [Lysobacter sp. S4-A87]UNK50186.1 type 1 fimbrial protein [Lysobacter sp. S4-A87]